MKTIPQIRTELLHIVDTHEITARTANKIRYLVSQMKRRPAIRRANKDSVTFTPILAAKIRTFARLNPNASYQVMAKKFTVSTGRVSEAIAGKRAA